MKVEIEDQDAEEPLLEGFIDTLVLQNRFWVVLIESKRYGVSVMQTLPPTLAYMMRFLEVRELGTDAVITVIELLSPKNKRTGTGRLAYEEKRQRVLSSPAHLIEIDLLRVHPPLPLRGGTQWDYRIVVSRSEQRPAAELYGFDRKEPILSFPLPLKSDAPKLWIDLQSIFAGVYTRAGYRYRIDYRQPLPPPKLSQEQE